MNGMSVVTIAAPIRHFQEIPGMKIEGDRIGIAVGGLYGTERDEPRIMHLTIFNHQTAIVEAVSAPRRLKLIAPATHVIPIASLKEARVRFGIRGP
jgi:hypothetical protein